jgi:hypothetical protein
MARNDDAREIDASREWFTENSLRWLDIMNGKNCACPNPMLLVKDHEGKNIDAMIQLEEGMKFSEFINDHMTDMIKNAREQGALPKAVGYFFHSQRPPDVRCKEKSILHMISFSRLEKGIMDHLHADVCVNKDDDGKDIVDVDLLKPGDWKFHESMKPLFTNPFFDGTDAPKCDAHPEYFEI